MATNLFFGKPIKELLDLLETQEPGHIGREQLKMTITSHFVQNLEEAIHHHRLSLEKMTESNNKLSNKIFYLNIVLTGATIVGSLIAYFEYIN